MDLTDDLTDTADSHDHFVVYELKEYNPLLDSSNMSIDDWIKIAIDLKKHYSSYDGFVVLQGTDTMAYTSSALSFILENLQKPVIVTGSQVPLFELITDARDNLVESLIYAGCFSQIHEVALYFDRKLFRGNRSVKKCNYQFDAFDSPNFPVLANTGTQIQIYEDILIKTPCKICTDNLSIFTNLNRNVGSFYIFPTFTTSQLKCFLDSPLEGLVLHSYGVGNVPSDRRDIIDILANAVKRGILIVNLTLCYKGTVSDSYETGKVLEKIGVLSGYDMTPEAALTKLIYVLGKADNYEARVKMLKMNLRGEFTDKSNWKTNDNNNINNNNFNNTKMIVDRTIQENCFF